MSLNIIVEEPLSDSNEKIKTSQTHSEKKTRTNTIDNTCPVDKSEKEQSSYNKGKHLNK